MDKMNFEHLRIKRKISRIDTSSTKSLLGVNCNPFTEPNSSDLELQRAISRFLTKPERFKFWKLQKKNKNPHKRNKIKYIREYT